ncbi:uncharacterized protein LOC130642346 [Hydractinia symbiolongicarpus]|uniref:uncharacterized protein LOC130639268 n=1 Tax=Hydractinia symbiolongicarpus TaxID=13093 RepID=UPI00254FD4F3|nr:uncharacterized protein LOC130639268 [Hydractinia symbiolongicarpus]XP_057305417.1 uncharacterized protein LOC130642346 [Hydractinia symbiolongicarpus]
MKKSLKALVYGENVTPLPAFKVFSLFLMLVFNSMMNSSAHAYLPQLVKSFGISEVDTGQNVGIIVSSYYVSRTFSSLFWGYLADRISKKYVFIISSIGTALFTIAFGFTTSFKWAVVTKFAAGCCAGMVVVSKAIIADICDNTNMSLGVTIIVSSYSTGFVLGPVLGGYLSFPAEKYDGVFSKDSVFGRYSILLPNLLMALVMLLLLVIFVLAFAKKSSNSYEVVLDLQRCKYGATERRKTVFSSMLTTSQLIAQSSQWKRLKNWMFNTTFCRLLRFKSCVMSCTLAGTCYMLAVAYQDIYPVFAATAKEYNGYGFSSQQIGLCLLIVTCLMILIQVPLIGKLTSKFGSRKVFVFASLMMVFCLPMNVSIAVIINKYLFWICLVVMSLLTRLALEGGFVTVNVFLNNSVPSDLVGSANGLCMSLTCLTRSVAPTLFGSVFSWSLGNIKDVEDNENPLGFPFNQYFTFYLLSFLSIFNAFFATQLPKLIDRKQY